MQEYLEPAIRELKGQKQGSGPGQVFHEYALFCDKQLQSPEAAEDMDRIKTVMDRKWQEYNEFTKLSKTDKSKGMRDTYHRSARRAKTWYDLDNAEYERLRKGREEFLRQCLENYLLSLMASDEYNQDALRVFSLWLEYADTDLANAAVRTNLKEVPSGKFALLMNQLSSRLQAEETAFHNLLMELVYRICVDHPYHGMHQIFAIQMKVGAITREDAVRAKDESARSRQKAAGGLATALGQDKKARSYWSSIYQSNEIFHHLAMFKGEKESTQQGRELPLDRYKESKDLVSKVPKLNVPPATLQVEVRASKNYTDLPRIQKFKPTMSIANGLSAPKVITAIGTDGRPYKQLVSYIPTDCQGSVIDVSSSNLAMTTSVKTLSWSRSSIKSQDSSGTTRPHGFAILAFGPTKFCLYLHAQVSWSLFKIPYRYIYGSCLRMRSIIPMTISLIDVGKRLVRPSKIHSQLVQRCGKRLQTTFIPCCAISCSSASKIQTSGLSDV
jgi:ataxia telangiectasia mutated family protein